MSATHPKKKVRMVRDRFAMPKDEYAAIDLLKSRAIAIGTSVKKSELLRAGLMALKQLNDAAYKRALAAVPRLGKVRAPSDPLVPAKAPPLRKRAATPKPTAAPATPVEGSAKPRASRPKTRAFAKKANKPSAAAKA